MGTIYLQEQGAKVSRQGRRLLVSKDDQPLLSIPVHRLQRLVEKRKPFFRISFLLK